MVNKSQPYPTRAISLGASPILTLSNRSFPPRSFLFPSRTHIMERPESPTPLRSQHQRRSIVFMHCQVFLLLRLYFTSFLHNWCWCWFCWWHFHVPCATTFSTQQPPLLLQERERESGSLIGIINGKASLGVCVCVLDKSRADEFGEGKIGEWKINPALSFTRFATHPLIFILLLKQN